MGCIDIDTLLIRRQYMYMQYWQMRGMGVRVYFSNR